MKKAILILFLGLLAFGCVAETPKTGCAYDNPPCGEDYECIDNECVLKSGCLYNNPVCGDNYNCINNSCVLKSGCHYDNPECGENYDCVNNECVLREGCAYDNPRCEEDYECINNTCILKRGCAYDNPLCDEDYDCINNTCIMKQGCMYDNPACDENYTCMDNVCILKSGCLYNNPSCSEGYFCEENVCVKPSYCLNDECNGKGLDFVIITRPMFLTTKLNEFSEWKEEDFGFDVGVFTVDYIIYNYDGLDIGEQIRNAIHTTKSENGARYFLLIGDTEIEMEEVEGEDVYTRKTLLASYDLNKEWNVPTMGYSVSIFDYDISRLDISDLQYTDENDWNSYEFEPNKPTFEASAYVGRWPIKTTEELENIVEKTINVKKINKFYFVRDETLADRSQCDGWPINTSKQFQDIYCYLDIFWTLQDELFDDVDKKYVVIDTSDSGEVQSVKQDILSADDNTAVIELAHGSPCGAFGLGLEVWNVNDFENSFPLFNGESCHIGAFYNPDPSGYCDETYAESLIAAEKGPVVYVSPLNHYFFYRDLLDGESVGEAFYSGANIYANIPNPTWLFGDPSLVLYED